MVTIDLAGVAMAAAEESHPGRVVGTIFGQLLIMGLIVYFVVRGVLKLTKGPSRPGAAPAYWQGYPPQPGAAWPAHPQANWPQHQPPPGSGWPPHHPPQHDYWARPQTPGHPPAPGPGQG